VRSGGTALGASSLAAFLAACGNEGTTPGPQSGGSSGSSTPMGPGGIPLARRSHPVTLPLYDDNPPIDSGLAPETGGTLNIYNWADYLDPALVKEFGKQHGVDVKVSTFNSMDEAVAKLQTGAVDYDIFFPTTDQLPKLVAAKLLKPLNMSYIPNLQASVWPEYVAPFYDRPGEGEDTARYTVPYVIYSTGISWRNDHVTLDVPSLGWDVFWQASDYKGKVALLDDSREAISLGLMKNGIFDLNTEKQSDIDTSLASLKELSSSLNVKTAITDYQTIPEGRTWLHQSWSGDIVAGALFYMPKGVKNTVIDYWFPEDGKGPLGNDTITVMAGSKKPVLAHMFLDFMLDSKNSISNFVNYVGYQPPVNASDPDTLISDGIIPAHLASVIVKRDAFDGALEEGQLTPAGAAMWENAWSEFKAGT
jgi:spermidine/putrescine transport system substrate-binding protein